MWTTWSWDGETLLDGQGRPVELGQERSHGDGVLRHYASSEAKLVAFFKGNPRRYICSVKLQRPGKYRFGEEFGHRVLDAGDEKDPIKRVFRELDIPCSERALTIVKPCTPEDLHDIIVEARAQGVANAPGIGVFERNDQGQVVASYVFEGADPGALKAFLLRLVYGPDADEDFLPLVQARDLSMAQRWVSERFEVASGPCEGDRLEWTKRGENDGRTNLLYFRLNGKQQTVVTTNLCFIELVARYGWQVFASVVSETSASWMRATNSLGAAVEYISVLYDVVYIEGMPSKRPLRVRRAFSLGSFSEPGDSHLGNHTDVLELLKVHPVLPERLKKQPGTVLQRVCDYNEKVLCTSRDAGNKILFTRGSVTFEQPREDYDVVPLAGVEGVLLRNCVEKRVLNKGAQAVAAIEGDFLFDGANERLIIKRDAPGRLLALVWEDGKYNVLSLSRNSETRMWTGFDPGKVFEVFLEQRNYFRMIQGKERLYEGRPFLILSR